MTVNDLTCPGCRRPVRVSERVSCSAGKIIYGCRDCDRRYALRAGTRLEEEGDPLDESGQRTVRMRRPATVARKAGRLQEYRAPSVKGSMPRGIRMSLEFTDGPERGRTMAIRRTKNVMGRSGGEIKIRDLLISRRHALLEVYDRETIILKDLSSTNGTYHNGRLIDHCRLEDGDEVRLGHSLMNVVIERVA